MERILHDKPPRSLDIFTQAVILFGGFNVQFGLGFVAFGSIFVWAFGMNSEAITFFEKKADWVEHFAVVERMENTNASENNQTIYKCHYKYIVDATEYSGKGYTLSYSIQEGSEIRILYNKNQVDKSKMKDGRTQPFPWWVVLIVFIFPLSGTLLAVFGISKNINALKLFKQGYFTKGVMQSKVSTGGSITIDNRRYPIHDYEFTFEVEGKTYIGSCRTHLAEKVEDEEEEIILYDQFYPESNVVFDSIGNAPAISDYGNFVPFGSEKAVYLIIPTLVILMNVAGYAIWSSFQ